MQNKAEIKVVSLKELCTACVIIGGLVRETLEKIKKSYRNLQIEYIELENLKNVHEIEGLEVEKFPAILIRNEQVTAGTLPSMRQLLSLLQQGGLI